MDMDDATADVASVPSNTNRQQDSRFSCNICLDPVTEPVVTRCGHLFCWPCLFQWLAPSIRPEEALDSWNDTLWMAGRRDESRRCCPVCKAECSVPTLVPIYVRNEPGTPLQSTRKTPQEEEANTNEPRDEQQQQETEEEPSEETRVEETQDVQERETTGLRQRLRFRSRDSEIPEIPIEDETETAATNASNNIPSRPAANSPARPSATRNTTAIMERSPAAYAAGAAHRPPLSPRQGSSLSQGMLLMFQQALNNADASYNAAQQQHANSGRTVVPPLHQTDGANTNTRNEAFAANHTTRMESPQDDATEFLSRLLLILASFVILCLLLF